MDMKLTRAFFTFAFLASGALLRLSADDKVMLGLNFDESDGLRAACIGDTSSLTVTPQCDWIKGVSGNAILFNGFTTRIVVPLSQIPAIRESFTIDLWFAPASFPKSPCPLVAWQSGEDELPLGFALEIDAHGIPSFRVAPCGEWIEARAGQPLALNQWSRITCAYDYTKGLKLAVNGTTVAANDGAGRLQKPQTDMWIGRTPFKVPSQYENESIPIFCSLDGAIDMLRLLDRSKAYAHILQERFAQPEAPPFEVRRLPSGPAEPLAFGSWYIPLKYYKQWDEQWRGDTPDVVMAFGESLPFRVVFWRGIEYAPCFVTEKGFWMSNEFVERRHVTGWGCCESMSDKHADFSSVRIIENTPARTVVLWRNAPVGVNLKFPFQDSETGWGDWSEETYTFYPDGTGVRKMVVWSSNLDDWYEWCQSLQVLHPGQRPEDILDGQRIMSVANMQGESRTYGWDWEGAKRQHEPTIPGANIQVTYMRSHWNPFLILDDSEGPNEEGGNGPEIHRYAGRWSEYSDFPWRNHWPVNQDMVIGRYAVAPDGPSHTYTATQYNAMYSRMGNQMTKLMLCGCTDKDAADLLPLAKSWLRAPRLRIVEGPCKGGSYDMTERAYRLQSLGHGPLTLRLDASSQHPACGICLLVEKWQGSERPKISVDGKDLQGDDLRVGVHQNYDGNTLILWLNLHAETSKTITIGE